MENGFGMLTRPDEDNIDIFVSLPLLLRNGLLVTQMF